MGFWEGPAVGARDGLGMGADDGAGNPYSTYAAPVRPPLTPRAPYAPTKISGAESPLKSPAAPTENPK